MNALPALATIADIDLGRDLTDTEAARAERLLAQVSARFRREARQQFTPGTSTTRLRVQAGVTYLPQAPVVDVLNVTTLDGRPITGWTLAGQALHITQPVPDGTPRPPMPLGQLAELRRLAAVLVTYTHGGTVPDLVAATVAGAVTRVMNLDPDAAAGTTQVTDTRGPFSRTRQFATWAVGGQALLSPDELAVAHTYRPHAPRLWVMNP